MIPSPEQPIDRPPDWVRPAVRQGRLVLFAIAAGLLQAICFPPVGWAILLPLSLGAFFALLEGQSVKWALQLGFYYGAAWALADLYWLARIFGPAAVSLCAIIALFPALFAGAFVWIRRVLPKAPAAVLAALLWTGVEMYRSELFILKFGWLGLGYGAVERPAFALLASWLGCYGISFLIVLAAGALANSGLDARWKTLAAAAWIILFCLPGRAPQPDRPITVRLVQAPSEDDQSLFSGARTGGPADAIVWPEYSFVSDPRRQRLLWAKLRSVPIDQHALFIFGAKDEFNPADPAGYRNTAFVLDSAGALIGTHVKNHTVHFFRDGVPGTDASAIPTALGRIGVAICFDMDYPDVARRLAEDGAEVFLVPNDDPAEWGPVQRSQHRQMFEMRAAECGRWLARADVAGGTSAAAPNGREASRITTTGPGELTVTIGRVRALTPFVRGGWMFGRACLAVSAAMIAWCAVVAVRRRGEDPTS